MKLSYTLVLVTMAFADNLIPLVITCKDCTNMLPTATTNLHLNYFNPFSALPPFPYLSDFDIIVINQQTSKIISKKHYIWKLTQTDLVIPFRPDEWNVAGPSFIAIKINWHEKFHDESLGGYGSHTLLYINVINPTGIGSDGTLVIGSSSAAIGCGLFYWILTLLLVL
jgi:hypothetical protein